MFLTCDHGIKNCRECEVFMKKHGTKIGLSIAIHRLRNLQDQYESRSSAGSIMQVTVRAFDEAIKELEEEKKRFN